MKSRMVYVLAVLCTVAASGFVQAKGKVVKGVPAGVNIRVEKYRPNVVPLLASNDVDIANVSSKRANIDVFYTKTSEWLRKPLRSGERGTFPDVDSVRVSEVGKEDGPFAQYALTPQGRYVVDWDREAKQLDVYLRLPKGEN
jgi:hypothetical protein